MVLSWLRNWIDLKPKARSRRRVRPFRLRAERLEDRTTPSAVLLKDVNTNNADAFTPYSTTNAVEMNGRLFFFANDGVHGTELMSTDGTAAGTKLVKDINPGSVGSQDFDASPSIVASGGLLYFSADDGVHGAELWASDGTAAGTHMVDDINPATYPNSMPTTDGISSNISSLTAFDGKVLFSADDGIHGQELWTSDGTAAGTHLMLDINPVASIAVPPPIATPPNPTPSPTTQASNPHDITVVGNKAFFSADDGTHGDELWVTDGTAAGTQMVKDIAAENTPGSPFGTSIGSNPANLTADGSKLFFTTSDGEVWATDGTAAGTISVADSNLYSSGNLIAVGQRVYYQSYNSTYGNALVGNDGGEHGTVFYVPIGGPNATNMPATFDFASVGNTLYFIVTPAPGATGTLTNPQLWTSDGSLWGTVKIADLPTSSTSNFSSSTNLTAYGNQLYFNLGQTLWTSDGTAAGTKSLKTYSGSNYDPGPMTVAQFRNEVFLVADDGIHGNELWETNGTTAGTTMLTQINPTTLDSNPSNFTTIGGTTFFTADDGSNGYALWKTDGTAAGTVMIKDVAPGLGNGLYPPVESTAIAYPFYNVASIGDLTAFNGKLYFTASDANGSGTHLWRSDGTAAGTIELTGGEEGGGPVKVEDLTVVGNTLYYTITNNSGTTGLWETNGSNNGATHVVDQEPSSPIYYPMGAAPATDIAPFPFINPVIQDLKNVNGTLYFVGTDSIHGSELWTSDGTTAGTHMVMDINPNNQPATTVGGNPIPDGSNIQDIVALNGKAYFIADDGTHGSELWTSDGTLAGTHIVDDVNPGSQGSLDWLDDPDSSTPTLWKAAGKLYFNADDGVHGQELWISDGTAAGTHLLKDINPGPQGSDIQNVRAVNGEVYFSADDGVHGQELWKTDGTTAGTLMLKDIWPGTSPASPGGTPNSSDPSNLTNVNGTLYFTATDAAHGTELWMSDGTTKGTVMVADLNPGPASAFLPWNSHAIARSPEGGVFVSADDGVHGRELWAINEPAPAPVSAGGSYTVTEGGTLQLHASIPGRTDSGSLIYMWDLNGGGKFDSAKGANPTLDGAQLRALGLTGASSPYTIQVMAFDRAGNEIGVGTAQLTVHNAPLTVSGFTYDVTEGQKFNRNVASFQDIGGIESASNYAAIIHWGDGTTSVGSIIRDGSSWRVAGAHAYASHGDFTVTVSISEDGATPVIATTTIHVHDAGLFTNRTYLRQTVDTAFTQTVALFIDRNPLGNISTLSAAIDWGDGTISAGTFVANASGGYNVVGTHTYTKVNDFAIRVHIVDAGVTTTVTSMAHVVAGQITARGLTAVGTAIQDSTYAIAAFRDTDPGAIANMFTATINWADGSSSTGTIESDGNGGFRVIGDHRYASTGLRSVRVTIVDGAGRSATTIGTARVMGSA